MASISGDHENSQPNQKKREKERNGGGGELLRRWEFRGREGSHSYSQWPMDWLDLGLPQGEGEDSRWESSSSPASFFFPCFKICAGPNFCWTGPGITLPALGHLPFLERLFIFEMNAVRRIGGEFYGDGGIFPSLRILNMRGLSDLEEWSTEATATGQPMMAFPCLEDFTLRGCPKLRVTPRVPPSVVELSIEANRILSAVSTEGLYKLRRLEIRDCEALSVSSWEWMQDLTALTTFGIADEKLSCLPEGILQLCMPTLERVRLTCPNLKFISGEEGDKQQQPPTFFVTIQNLHIVSLELTALPEWLGNLTSLQSLSISSCSPELERRCERERGKDWPMIAHIPDIEIWPKKDDRAETSQRPITRSIRNFRLTSCCIGRG